MSMLIWVAYVAFTVATVSVFYQMSKNPCEENPQGYMCDPPSEYKADPESPLPRGCTPLPGNNGVMVCKGEKK